MNDLQRMQNHYSKRKNNNWTLFNCYAFSLACKQKYYMTKLLSAKELPHQKILDIGAGEGNFILNLILLGANPKNITAVEYLKERYLKLSEKLPHVHTINQNYLESKFTNKFDLITIMAVLTSITDNLIRYDIVKKALQELSEDGILIIYDYFNEKENFLNDNYRAISLNKIQEIAKGYNIKIYKKVYLNSRVAKVLCKIKLQEFIPILEKFKIFNDNFYFIGISKC